MLSLLLATLPKCSAFQSTTILRLPTPRKPPKSITAARTVPSRSTITSTMRPMSSLAALRTSRPRMPCASRAPITVTDGGGAGALASACGAALLVVGGDAASSDAHTAVDAAKTAATNVIQILARIWPPHTPRDKRRTTFSMRQHDRHLDLTARAQHFERDLAVVAANAQIDAGSAQPQV